MIKICPQIHLKCPRMKNLVNHIYYCNTNNEQIFDSSVMKAQLNSTSPDSYEQKKVSKYCRKKLSNFERGDVDDRDVLKLSS